MRISRAWPNGSADSSTQTMSAPRLVLVGLPGSGKSTVGPLVAARLGWSFVDLDEEIVRVAGRTIPEIFAAEGESGFRAQEHAATAALVEQGPLVLASGGGWMLDPANRGVLGLGTEVVYLEVSPEVAATRMGGAASARPLLAGDNLIERLADLLARRKLTYLQANHTVSVDLLGPEEVAALIVALASA
jgi:shikimate kinase